MTESSTETSSDLRTSIQALALSCVLALLSCGGPEESGPTRGPSAENGNQPPPQNTDAPKPKAASPPDWFQNRSWDDGEFRFFEARSEGATPSEAEKAAVTNARTEASQTIVVRIRSALASSTQQNTRDDETQMTIDVDEQVDFISESMVPNTSVERRASIPDGRGGHAGFARLKVPLSSFSIDEPWYRSRAGEALQRGDSDAALLWYQTGIQALEEDRSLREGIIDLEIQRGRLEEAFYASRDLHLQTKTDDDQKRTRDTAQRWADTAENQNDYGSACTALKALLDPSLGVSDRERVSERLARTFQKRSQDAKTKGNLSSALIWLREGLSYATDDDTRQLFQAEITSLDRRTRDLFKLGIERLTAAAQRGTNDEFFKLGGTENVDVRIGSDRIPRFSAWSDTSYRYFAIWIEADTAYAIDFFSAYQDRQIVSNGGPALFPMNFTSDSAKGNGWFIALASEQSEPEWRAGKFIGKLVNDPTMENLRDGEDPTAKRFDAFIEAVVKSIDEGRVRAFAFQFRVL